MAAELVPGLIEIADGRGAFPAICGLPCELHTGFAFAYGVDIYLKRASAEWFD